MSYRQEANVTPEITACKINSYERSYIFEDAEESSEKGVCKAREMIQRDNIRMIEDTIIILNMQRKRKLAPFSDLTAHPDLSPMHLDDIFGDKQAKAGPFWSRESTLVECVKSVKDPGLILRRNSDPGIFDSGF